MINLRNLKNAVKGRVRQLPFGYYRDTGNHWKIHRKLCILLLITSWYPGLCEVLHFIYSTISYKSSSTRPLLIYIKSKEATADLIYRTLASLPAC